MRLKLNVSYWICACMSKLLNSTDLDQSTNISLWVLAIVRSSPRTKRKSSTSKIICQDKLVGIDLSLVLPLAICYRNMFKFIDWAPCCFYHPPCVSKSQDSQTSPSRGLGSGGSAGFRTEGEEWVITAFSRFWPMKKWWKVSELGSVYRLFHYQWFWMGQILRLCSRDVRDSELMVHIFQTWGPFKSNMAVWSMSS